ncbi:peptidoglycan-binding protein, partial [Nostoc sp. NIES-2111]
ENGQLNSETKFALEKFQGIVGLEKTGILNEGTWNAINLILAKRIIRPNHAGGPVVRYLQFRVGVEVDGIYGAQTEAAIKRFQRQNGLLADGIVGPVSWQKLIG